jgi:hypothetical protein
LSVVVPSVSGLGCLLECLGTLHASAASGVALDVIVVDRCGPDVRRLVAERFPAVHVIAAAPDASIPQMRAIGFRHARAGAVAVIEDHVLVPADWPQHLLSALAAGHEVVGGSVVNAATDRLVNRAAFLCEYSHLLPPIASGAVEALAGNNVVYTRALLDRYADVIDAGGWEDQLHAALRRDGVRLTCVPDICVTHKMPYRIPEYLSQRFLYSRSYAGLRRASMSLGKRMAFSVGTLLLPPALLLRIVLRVWPKRAHRRDLVASLPLLMLFVCAWAAGEMVGYAAGPGRALARVR